MKKNPFRELCTAQSGSQEVLQGNIAFAVGCVRSGIHSVDGYPGTPSTEVIDRGLSQVQDLISVGWSVNEAVAVGVAFGQTLAGNDSVVTMKIPGLFQAGDVFTSSSFFTDKRGALVYFIASDFTPSSTQHLVDPRYLFKSCFLPVFEPSSHQEMLEAAGIAADMGRRYNTPVVVLASGALCHSEGLVRLQSKRSVPSVEMPQNLRQFNLLPVMARKNYDTVMAERMASLKTAVEDSSLNKWTKSTGKTGIITYGADSAYVQEVQEIYGSDIDTLSLGFTNPLPENLIKKFHASIEGTVYVIEDGSSYVQDQIKIMGLPVEGKKQFSPLTEYSPAIIAENLGLPILPATSATLPPVQRPPLICAGCPYTLFSQVITELRKRDKIDVAFGDIGCNALLYFMNSVDTGLAMGASESKRAGYVLAKPEMAGKCLSIVGDSTECHSGMDATRNSVFRNIPGVKVVLDNYWTAMTGGQPAPTSPVNLAGDPNAFDLDKALAATGAKTVVVDSYEVKPLRKVLRSALKDAGEGVFTTIVVRGGCIKKIPTKNKGIRLQINEEKCQKCHTCLVCPGIQADEGECPTYNNFCSGCGEQGHACQQMCPFGAIETLPANKITGIVLPSFDEPPGIDIPEVAKDSLPQKLSLAIRGVGGQGNLFFGKVLTQVAFLAGYGGDNIVKGETHGMAQMGGPVISTFSCGKVHSPVLVPGTVDCLIAMEMSELLRPGFLELLKKDGIVLSAATVIKPQNLAPEDYPDPDAIRQMMEKYRYVELDILSKAVELGDIAGRSANVVMIGALSTIAPFSAIPVEIWLQAIKNVSPILPLWAANYHAFMSGRELL